MEEILRSCLMASFCLLWSLSSKVTLWPFEEARVWAEHFEIGRRNAPRRFVDGTFMIPDKAISR
jgi:hypothetical protein